MSQIDHDIVSAILRVQIQSDLDRFRREASAFRRDGAHTNATAKDDCANFAAFVLAKWDELLAAESAKALQADPVERCEADK